MSTNNVCARIVTEIRLEDDLSTISPKLRPSILLQNVQSARPDLNESGPTLVYGNAQYASSETKGHTVFVTKWRFDDRRKRYET